MTCILFNPGALKGQKPYRKFAIPALILTDWITHLYGYGMVEVANRVKFHVFRLDSCEIEAITTPYHSQSLQSFPCKLSCFEGIGKVTILFATNSKPVKIRRLYSQRR